jgi:hypothetical protein
MQNVQEKKRLKQCRIILPLFKYGSMFSICKRFCIVLVFFFSSTFSAAEVMVDEFDDDIDVNDDNNDGGGDEKLDFIVWKQSRRFIFIAIASSPAYK